MAIHIGIGGWTYEPWRGTFYPPKHPKKRELDFAGERLTGIEIDGTYYSSQKPETITGWAAAVPEGFKLLFIAGAKLRNPAAAQALIARL